MSIKRCIPSQPGLADIGRIFLVSLIMVMIGGNRQAWAQATKAGSTRQAATRPDKPVKLTDCVSAECHANIKASQVLHSPVASNT